MRGCREGGLDAEFGGGCKSRGRVKNIQKSNDDYTRRDLKGKQGKGREMTRHHRRLRLVMAEL